MSAVLDKLDIDIKAILNATWDERDGQVVPKTEDIVLKNGAVKLDAVFLYADLAHSTKLVRAFSDSVPAKVVRAYLSSMSSLVNQAGGEIRSFDGDRVMGVFVGGSKNSSAAKCALKMNYVITKVLRPAVESKYPSLKRKGFEIEHCVGVASSNVLVVRAGVRGSNDLVFVGAAPNLAAKLSDVRNGNWNTYITHHVYSNLSDEAKFGGSAKQNMWTSVERTLGDENWDCYKSTWRWTP